MLDFPRDFPRRGEIYWGPADKKRPLLVVSADSGNKYSNAVVVAAITSAPAKREYAVDVFLPAGDPLPKEGRVLCRNLYTLLKTELGNYRFDLKPEQMAEVDLAIVSALELPRPN